MNEMLLEAGVKSPSQSDIKQVNRFISGTVKHPRNFSLLEQLWNLFRRVKEPSLERSILDFYAASLDTSRDLKNICGTFFQYKLASDDSEEVIQSLVKIKETDARLISVDERQRDMGGTLAEDYKGVVILKGEVYIFFMREIKKKDPKTIYVPIIKTNTEGRIEIAMGYSMEVCRAYSPRKIFLSNVWLQRQEGPLNDLERECKRVDQRDLEEGIRKWLSRGWH